MNNKGQSTVIFIILIPIILLVLAFIFDNGMIIVENTRFKSTSKTIIKDLLTNSYTNYADEAKKMYEKNKFETDLLDVKYDNGYLTIYNSHSYNSFFGKILGIRSYRCEINYRGHVKDGKVVIEVLPINSEANNG